MKSPFRKIICLLLVLTLSKEVLSVSSKQIQILSDVDDTLICNKSISGEEAKPGGIYKWLEDHALYPGAIALQHELAKSKRITNAQQ